MFKVFFFFFLFHLKHFSGPGSNSIALLENLSSTKNLGWRVLSDLPSCIFLTVMVQPFVTETGLQSLREILLHLFASTEKCTSKFS